jgi:hypothetical protein
VEQCHQRHYPPDDLDWIGSQYFQDTDGYYGNANLNLSIRASEELPGFPYNAARDTEYLPGFIPAWGRPECNDWWNNATSGIMPRLMALIDSAAITQATIETGDIAQGAAGVGLTVELASWIPKIYALRQAAPVGQSFILMGIYTFLPFILVAMLMFVVLPIVWFKVIGWAGLTVNRTLDAFKDITGPSEWIQRVIHSASRNEG